MHQFSYQATTCGGEAEKEKLQCFCFRFVFLSNWSGNGFRWGCSAGQLGPMCFHLKKKTNKKNNKNTASGRDVSSPVHREDQGYDNLQCTLLLLLPPASYAIYSYLQYLTPGLHGTTRNEFSVWSHVNKGIERRDKLVIKNDCSLCKSKQDLFKFILKTWGLKQHICQFLIHCGWFSRWTLGHASHINILTFCTYPVKNRQKGVWYGKCNALLCRPYLSFQPIRATLTVQCQFFHY